VTGRQRTTTSAIVSPGAPAKEREGGAAPAQRGQRAVELERPGRQAFGQAPGNLVVAAVDVEAFVGFDSEGTELDQHRDR
jgi:hypothetical protein